MLLWVHALKCLSDVSCGWNYAVDRGNNKSCIFSLCKPPFAIKTSAVCNNSNHVLNSFFSSLFCLLFISTVLRGTKENLQWWMWVTPVHYVWGICTLFRINKHIFVDPTFQLLCIWGDMYLLITKNFTWTHSKAYVKQSSLYLSYIFILPLRSKLRCRHHADSYVVPSCWQVCFVNSESCVLQRK